MSILTDRREPLLLATGVHVIDLVGRVMVQAFAAIEFVPLSIESFEKIFAIPATEHVLVFARGVGVGLMFPEQVVIACPTVEDVAAWTSPEHVVALVASHLAIGAHQQVVAWPAVEGVLVFEAADLVVAFHPVQLFGSVGTDERSVFGTAGHVVRDQGAQVAGPV